MAPNIHAATLLTHHSAFDEFPVEDTERYLSTNAEHPTKTFSTANGNDIRQTWRSMIEGNLPSKEDVGPSMRQLLSSIRVLDDPSRHEDWLSAFGGTLQEVPLDQVAAIHDKAPQRFTARVADFNDNLMYAMQSERGLQHLGLKFELQQLQAHEYLGSFLTTEHTIAQPPHVDYTWEILDNFSPQDLKIGFFPLTQDGMFLQVWPRDDHAKEVPGQLIFIPFGKLLTLPAHTIHGGGFRTSHPNQGPYGNLRFHLYIARNLAKLPTHQTNKYTEPTNKGMELSWRYTDAPTVEALRKYFFV